MPEPALTQSETVMAFDFGEQRVGIAVGETLLGEARALATVTEAANDRRFAAIGRLIAEWHPVRLIVGVPHNTVPDQSSEHELAARCERFARQLNGRFGLPVELTDESYSSCIAAAQLTGDRCKNKARLDAEAAAIILQAWFDQHHVQTPVGH